MVEYWTLIKEYPLYEVSNLGNVRRKSTGQLMIAKIYNKYFRGKYHTYIKSHIEDLLDEAFIKTYEKLGNGKPLCLNLYYSLLGVIKQFCRGKRRECLIDDSRTMDYLDTEYGELR